MKEIKFEKGQRVITPQGEAEITVVKGNEIEVKLNSGEIKSYPKDKVTDDSDAG